MRAGASVWGFLPLLLVSLAGACSSTPEAPTSAQITDEVSSEATIVAVNKDSRELTLQKSDGSRVIVVAGPGVRNFDRIAPGNKVTARYVVSLSARRLEPDEPGTVPTVGVGVARAKEGDAPAGAIGAGVAMTVVVKSVDPKLNLVVFATPDGALHAVEAERDEGKRFIAGLKPGDRVELACGEALVLAVE